MSTIQLESFSIRRGSTNPFNLDRLSDQDALDLVEVHFVGAPVIELRRPRRGVVGDRGRALEGKRSGSGPVDQAA